ncbi:MAG: amidohydrolase [Natronomonas sp.]
MTQAADRIFTGSEIHTLAGDGSDGSALDVPEDDDAAVAVRDGRIVRVGSAYEVGFLEGVETDVVEFDGGVLLPGFIDAHTHMEVLGRRERGVDLGGVPSRSAAIERLSAAVESTEDDAKRPVLGYGYDESTWADDGVLEGSELDAVSERRPVIAWREDLHLVSVNTAARRRYDLPDGKPSGVLREADAEAVRAALSPDRTETRRLLDAAIEYAHERGVTGVHDMVRNSEAPAVYRELAAGGDLELRVRLYYWRNHVDAIEETGLLAEEGPFVRIGGIKTYTDGSIGARTARLSEPYADADTRGRWIVRPEALGALTERVEELGLPLAVHAIGDEAVAAAAECLSGRTERHRIEHAELLGDLDPEALGVVASMQPNFLRWARDDGLYERRLGEERTRRSNRFADVLAADVPLAFGSDCMPLDPLYGIQEAVTAPEPGQRLDVTAAVRAYTTGGAYAAGDEDELGTIEAGKRADVTVLDASPWDVPADSIADIDVAATVVDGEVVYRNRS